VWATDLLITVPALAVARANAQVAPTARPAKGEKAKTGRRTTRRFEETPARRLFEKADREKKLERLDYYLVAKNGLDPLLRICRGLMRNEKAGEEHRFEVDPMHSKGKQTFIVTGGAVGPSAKATVKISGSECRRPPPTPFIADPSSGQGESAGEISLGTKARLVQNAMVTNENRRARPPPWDAALRNFSAPPPRPP